MSRSALSPPPDPAEVSRTQARRSAATRGRPAGKRQTIPPSAVREALRQPFASGASRRLNGVSFVACENTLKDKSIPKDKLLAGVATVPTGAVEIISKQREGDSYFKPQSASAASLHWQFMCKSDGGGPGK